MIVFADADPAVAIPAIAYGIFYNMGQTCTAGTRLYVHKDIADTILTGLKAFAEGMSIGVGLDPKTQIGPLVSQEQFDRVSAYVKAGLADGAKLYCGGNRAGSEGYFLEPTILTETSAEMSVVRKRSLAGACGGDL